MLWWRMACLSWVPAAVSALSLVALATACGQSNAAPDPDRASASATAAAAPPPPQKIEWVKIPVAMDPAAFVRGELDRASRDKKKLLVYVGATWCEPCQRFHKAAEAGQLDQVFPDLRFVELDNDADASVIGALGCGSKLIPMFSVPDASGRCTDQRIEGGIKGDGAVGYIAPRLRALVGPP